MEYLKNLIPDEQQKLNNIAQSKLKEQRYFIFDSKKTHNSLRAQNIVLGFDGFYKVTD